ncbi:MAG: D-alanine--D-alanine ligase [Actinobacteria bacterium]|nr:D-alanine--D-alanine ligase [Actinomycetota bacterium]
MRVGVVFGGRSVEHDVSIVTAHQAMAVLAEGHDVVPIYVTREGTWLTGPGLNDLDVYRTKRWDEVGDEVRVVPGGTGGLVAAGSRLRGSRHVPLDVVLCSIHGTYGEDGTLQGLLEMAGLPYTGSGVAASAVGMDKRLMNDVFRAAGLPTVPNVEVAVDDLDRDADAIAGLIEDGVGYPVFVKPVHAGSSVGIAKATDREELHAALDVARRYDDRLLAEKGMTGCIEVNCSVLGGGGRPARVSVCEQPVAWEEFLSFDDKYLRSRKGRDAPSKSAGMASLDRKIPAPIPDEVTKQVQDNALAAFRAVGASGVARVDSFVDEETGETWLMEINTMPGSFAFYLWEATGMSFAGLMEELLAIGIAEHARRGELLFTFDSGMLDKQRWGKSGG